MLLVAGCGGVWNVMHYAGKLEKKTGHWVTLADGSKELITTLLMREHPSLRFKTREQEFLHAGMAGIDIAIPKVG